MSSDQQGPRVRCGVCRRVLQYGTSGNALTSRPHLPVSQAERRVMQQMVEAQGSGAVDVQAGESATAGPKRVRSLPPDTEARIRQGSSKIEWRCPGRSGARGKAGHVHQVRRDRWVAFLEQRKAAGREGDDVFLGVDL